MKVIPTSWSHVTIERSFWESSIFMCYLWGTSHSLLLLVTCLWWFVLTPSFRCHMLLSDLMLYKHMIMRPPREVWIHTTFGLAIHHQLPHTSFSIPWFRLQDRSKFLSFEHISSLQWSMVIDLVAICDLGNPTILLPLLKFYLSSIL